MEGQLPSSKAMQQLLAACCNSLASGRRPTLAQLTAVLDAFRETCRDQHNYGSYDSSSQSSGHLVALLAFVLRNSPSPGQPPAPTNEEAHYQTTCVYLRAFIAQTCGRQVAPRHVHTSPACHAMRLALLHTGTLNAYSKLLAEACTWLQQQLDLHPGAPPLRRSGLLELSDEGEGAFPLSPSCLIHTLLEEVTHLLQCLLPAAEALAPLRDSTALEHCARCALLWAEATAPPFASRHLTGRHQPQQQQLEQPLWQHGQRREGQEGQPGAFHTSTSVVCPVAYDSAAMTMAHIARLGTCGVHVPVQLYGPCLRHLLTTRAVWVAAALQERAKGAGSSGQGARVGGGGIGEGSSSSGGSSSGVERGAAIPTSGRLGAEHVAEAEAAAQRQRGRVQGQGCGNGAGSSSGSGTESMGAGSGPGGLEHDPRLSADVAALACWGLRMWGDMLQEPHQQGDRAWQGQQMQQWRGGGRQGQQGQGEARKLLAGSTSAGAARRDWVSLQPAAPTQTPPALLGEGMLGTHALLGATAGAAAAHEAAASPAAQPEYCLSPGLVFGVCMRTVRAATALKPWLGVPGGSCEGREACGPRTLRLALEGARRVAVRDVRTAAADRAAAAAAGSGGVAVSVAQGAEGGVAMAASELAGGRRLRRWWRVAVGLVGGAAGEGLHGKAEGEAGEWGMLGELFTPWVLEAGPCSGGRFSGTPYADADVVAALAAGWLPCVERLVRRAAAGERTRSGGSGSSGAVGGGAGAGGAGAEGARSTPFPMCYPFSSERYGTGLDGPCVGDARVLAAVAQHGEPWRVFSLQATLAKVLRRRAGRLGLMAACRLQLAAAGPEWHGCVSELVSAAGAGAAIASLVEGLDARVLLDCLLARFRAPPSGSQLQARAGVGAEVEAQGLVGEARACAVQTEGPAAGAEGGRGCGTSAATGGPAAQPAGGAAGLPAAPPTDPWVVVAAAAGGSEGGPGCSAPEATAGPAAPPAEDAPGPPPTDPRVVAGGELVATAAAGAAGGQAAEPGDGLVGQPTDPRVVAAAPPPTDPRVVAVLCGQLLLLREAAVNLMASARARAPLVLALAKYPDEHGQLDSVLVDCITMAAGFCSVVQRWVSVLCEVALGVSGGGGGPAGTGKSGGVGLDGIRGLLFDQLGVLGVLELVLQTERCGLEACGGATGLVPTEELVGVLLPLAAAFPETTWRAVNAGQRGGGGGGAAAAACGDGDGGGGGGGGNSGKGMAGAAGRDGDGGSSGGQAARKYEMLRYDALVETVLLPGGLAPNAKVLQAMGQLAAQGRVDAEECGLALTPYGAEEAAWFARHLKAAVETVGWGVEKESGQGVGAGPPGWLGELPGGSLCFCGNPRCVSVGCDSEVELLRGLKACGRCGGAWYCSRECQVAHWELRHRVECGQGGNRRAAK